MNCTFIFIYFKMSKNVLSKMADVARFAKIHLEGETSSYAFSMLFLSYLHSF